MTLLYVKIYSDSGENVQWKVSSSLKNNRSNLIFHVVFLQYRNNFDGEWYIKYRNCWSKILNIYICIYISKIFVGYQIMFWYTLTLYKIKIRINISVLLIIYRFFMEFQTISSIVLGKTKNINLWSLSCEQITRTYF